MLKKLLVVWIYFYSCMTIQNPLSPIYFDGSFRCGKMFWARGNVYLKANLIPNNSPSTPVLTPSFYLVCRSLVCIIFWGGWDGGVQSWFLHHHRTEIKKKENIDHPMRLMQGCCLALFALLCIRTYILSYKKANKAKNHPKNKANEKNAVYLLLRTMKSFCFY